MQRVRWTLRTAERVLVRHGGHLLAECTLLVVSFLPFDFSIEFRIALAAAAIVAFAASAMSIEADRFGRRADREGAVQAASASARNVLEMRLTGPTGLPPILYEQRVVTVRAVGHGERIDLTVSPQATLDHIRALVAAQRLEFAALVGTQLALLDVDVQRQALTALRNLDAAIAFAAAASDATWKRDVLASSGLAAPVTHAFASAYLEPELVDFHAAVERVADACEWIVSGGPPAGERPRRHVVRRSDRRPAAELVVMALVEGAIAHAAETQALNHSTLAGIPNITLRKLALAKDLTFTEGAQGNGWSGLQSTLNQESQYLQSGLEIVTGDLEQSKLMLGMQLLGTLRSAARMAHEAGESERIATDVRVKRAATDAIQVADDTYSAARRRFLASIADAVREGDVVLAALGSTG